jgi:hypothetical protein
VSGEATGGTRRGGGVELRALPESRELHGQFGSRDWSLDVELKLQWEDMQPKQTSKDSFSRILQIWPHPFSCSLSTLVSLGTRRKSTGAEVLSGNGWQLAHLAGLSPCAAYL